MQEKSYLEYFLKHPRTLEQISDFLNTEWRTTYRRLQSFHKECPLVSIFYAGHACFVLDSVRKQFDNKGRSEQAPREYRKTKGTKK